MEDDDLPGGDLPGDDFDGLADALHDELPASQSGPDGEAEEQEDEQVSLAQADDEEFDAGSDSEEEWFGALS